MRRLSESNNDINRWRSLEKKVAELLELASLESESGDASLHPELQTEVSTISARLDELEFQLAFSGEYDNHSAILAIHAGAGGVESQDWAEMLLRMYLRWAERHNYKAEVLDMSRVEEAGIKSATVEIRGEYGFGYLKSEHGVHRLIRLSPFDADHARHTSFVLVEVMPEAESDFELEMSPDDLKIETFRSSGPGGQHMQKTSSAVRITHLSTSITVSCQSERSQHQNKDIAMKILSARLLKLEMARREEERSKLKGKHIVAGWGNQIRSYILHPYKLVKDHRTDYQTSDIEAVLDGELDGFVSAYLRSGLSMKND
jgi:peptide chain release factor 2